MIETEQLEKLLSSVYEIIKPKTVNTAKKYNIFKVLNIQHKEVLICRLIGDLLSPYGFHNMGILPLKLFFENVLRTEYDEESLKRAKIILEEQVCDIGSSSNSIRRADIVIHSGKKIYPIEVKIWAGDQPKQLMDYYHHFFKDETDKIIYYLTPTGHKPSKDSKGDLNDKHICLLSFATHIETWLRVLLTECKDNQVKMIIEQFIDVIASMQGEEIMVNEINNLIVFDDEHKDSIETLSFICRNADGILKNIRTKYLKKCVKESEIFSLCNIENYTPDSWGNQALAFVSLNGYEDCKTWISLDGAGLYIITDAKLEGNNWKQAHDYSWKRITEGNNNIKLDSYEPKTIRIDSYIDEIINAINH